MTDILDKLRGEDLRSIGNADEVAQEIVNNPGQFKVVFSGLYDDEPVVRMKSADAWQISARWWIHWRGQTS